MPPIRAGDPSVYESEESPERGADDFQPFDLRHVTAILDDLNPGIGDAVSKLLSVDRGE